MLGVRKEITKEIYGKFNIPWYVYWWVLRAANPNGTYISAQKSRRPVLRTPQGVCFPLSIMTVNIRPKPLRIRIVFVGSCNRTYFPMLYFQRVSCRKMTSSARSVVVIAFASDDVVCCLLVLVCCSCVQVCTLLWRQRDFHVLLSAYGDTLSERGEKTPKESRSSIFRPRSRFTIENQEKIKRVLYLRSIGKKKVHKTAIDLIHFLTLLVFGRGHEALV